MNSGRLSSLAIVLWLISTAIVGVVGCVVLEQAQVSQPLATGQALAVVPLVEILFYLLILVAGSRHRMKAGRVVLGIGLGFIIRAGLSLIATQLVIPGQAAVTSMGAAFGLYYLRYWPGVVVQVLAVALFLWFLRGVWEVSEARSARALHQPRWLPEREEPEDERARRRQLLAALMEGPEEEAEPAGPGVEIALPSPPAQSEQLPLLHQQLEAPPSEKVGGEESGEDTSQLPVVSQAQVEEVSDLELSKLPWPEPQLSEAKKLLVEAAGEGAVADAVCLPGSGGLVWAAPGSLDSKALSPVIGQLVDMSRIIGEIARLQAPQVVVADGEGGCWLLAPIPQAPVGWWLGWAQATPVSRGAAMLALRQMRSQWPVVDITSAREQPAPEPGIAATQTEYDGPPEVVELVGQWGAQVTMVSIEDLAAIIAGPPGLNGEQVGGAGLQMWEVAIELCRLTAWDEPTALLMGFAGGVVGLGKIEGTPVGTVAMVIDQDTSQIAVAALRLDKLRQRISTAITAPNHEYDINNL